jgi:hypothetical protein
LLRSELRSRKIRLTTGKQAAAEVQVTLSENGEGFVWVAEIQKGSSRDVAMTTVARPPPDALHPAAEPLVVRKTRVYEQAGPMLDVVPIANSLADTSTPTAPAAAAPKLLVLGVGAVSLYEKAVPADKTPPDGVDSSTWQLKASMPISRLRPWPRDARGRLVLRTNNQFDVYFAGGKCSGTVEPAALQCQEGDEPWPLGAAGLADSTGPVAYFAPDRSYFDGRIMLEDGRELKAPPFFAAAVRGIGAGLKPGATIDRTIGATSGATSGLLLLTGLDDRTQLVNLDGASIANIGGFGSNIVGLETGCRSGWQILATATGDFNEPDAVEAYELVNHKAVEASAPAEFAGPVTELWPLANGSEAMAISFNLKTARYEAFRLSISCGQ